MSTQTLYLIFFGGLVPLMFLGYVLGRQKAITIRSQGIKMHSQPDQYGWFGALYTGLPIITIGVCGVFLYLFGVHAIPPTMLLAAALGVGALTLGLLIKNIQGTTKARDLVEDLIKGMLFTASLVSVLTTFGILLSIIFEALHFFQMQSFFHFIFGLEWSPDTAFLEGAGRADANAAEAKFGAVPIFAGTFYITAIAMVVAIPMGLLSAIFMSEYASSSVRSQVKPFLEILAGIPTVVYGFFAALTVAPLVVKFFAVFGIEAQYQNALSSGIIMGIMIIPFISSLSDDVISSVPQNMRNGAYALGMNKAETIRFVVLPSAMPGIIASILLGVSRALGETMIVVMAAGLRPNLTWNPLEDMTTVTVKIVESLTGDQEFNNPLTLSAFALGLVLFVVTLVINIISVSTIRKFHRKYKVSTL
ncbi:phosphate transport system permease protein PstC [Sulfurospirillum multivorans DSM 12446]|uniref:Phosphate transport system permease protein n=4 Tax=Sulfurospirillaceae TaxID=2932623 RepID=A0A1D7TMJ2_9BACT|nr:phosphate transport system permease protein PstC [Sulfurospirillum multivorans DSM 12446]AOO66124.1 phosphate transport system permease protein PstC [Sulfurospirillum halorespirans DSM 13726]QEH07317.1 phosphate transport system permease protein PstC [Sulfurospirillum multivorans]